MIYSDNIARAFASEPPAPKAPFGKRAVNRLRRMLTPSNQHRVHFVYIVPSDKIEVGTAAITKLAGDLQEWYRWQMGGKTFTLCDPIVQVCRSMYPAEWFSTYNPGADWRWWYWYNALGQLSALAGGGFWQEFDDWVVYLDAEPAEGQGAGGTSAGGYSGVAVLGARDLRALLGNDVWTPCREIGGAGHEAGHSMGLPHPPPGDPNWPIAIMGVGYGIYSNCILTPADKEWLNSSPFFTPQNRRQVSDICPFDSSQRPHPPRRPHPTPIIR